MLSDGRLLLGIGVGYLEPEMTAIGAPMHERGRRTDDYIAAMRAIWNEPGPVELREPVVPLRRRRRPSPTGAGRRPAGDRRRSHAGGVPAGGRAAATAGTASPCTPDATAACVAGLKEAADAVERPAELGPLEITVTPRGRLDAAGIEAFAAAGVDRLVMNTAGAADPDTVAERMQAAAALL